MFANLTSTVRTALSLGIFAMAACSGGDMRSGQTTSTPGTTPTPAQPVTESDTILIGEYGSTTGSESTFGKSTDNGVQLAVEERNAAGGVKGIVGGPTGKKITVKLYDDQGKTQEAGSAVTRLITQDHVVAIIGEVASSLSLAGGRVAQQYGVPMISPSSTNPAVTEIGDMISRVCFVDSFQGYVVAKFVRENLKLSKAALIYDQGQAYSKGLKDDFAREFQKMGGAITTEQAYGGGDADYSAQLTSIRESKPDVVFLPGYYTDAANVMLQARKLGLNVPFLGGDGWDSEKLAQIGGKAVEGSYYSNHYAHEDPRPEVQNFVKKYKEKYGAIPDGLAALGYDAAGVLFAAMEKAPSLDGKALATAINATKDYAGVTGKITIDPQRNARKSAVVLQMKGGVPVFAATVDPPDSAPAVAAGEAAPAAMPTPAEAAPPAEKK
jgi:branched-chain amino acid transport system substrate-binding protein